MDNPDNLCQECERPWKFMVDCGEPVDRFYCEMHFWKWTLQELEKRITG